MSKLPEAGDVFALEVSKGHDAVLRTIAAFGDTRCVVMTKYSAPTLQRVPRSKALFEVQPHSHHNWNRQVLGGWVNAGPPAKVRLLGNVPLRAGEAERVVHPQTWVQLAKKPVGMSEKVVPGRSWHLLMDQTRLQWRWEHERDAVLAEDVKREREKQQEFEAAVAAQGKRKAALQKKGVKALKKTKFFAAWKGAVPPAMIKAAESAMQEAVRSLEGKPPPAAARRLVKLVKTFNALDGAHGRSFDTIDREDIMEAIGTVALACGVSDEVFEEELDAARDF